MSDHLVIDSRGRMGTRLLTLVSETFTSEFLWSLYQNDDRRQNIVWLFNCVGINDATQCLVWKKGGAPIFAVFHKIVTLSL